VLDATLLSISNVSSLVINVFIAISTNLKTVSSLNVPSSSFLCLGVQDSEGFTGNSFTATAGETTVSFYITPVSTNITASDVLNQLTTNQQTGTLSQSFQNLGLPQTLSVSATCTTNCNNGSSGLSSGAIAGIVIGCIVGILLIVLLYCFCIVSSTKTKSPSQNEKPADRVNYAHHEESVSHTNEVEMADRAEAGTEPAETEGAETESGADLETESEYVEG